MVTRWQTYLLWQLRCQRANLGCLQRREHLHLPGPLGASLYRSRSPDGLYIASGGDDKTIQVWEASTGKSICTYKDHTSAANSLAWSPGSEYIASGGDDTTVHVCEISTGSPLIAYNCHSHCFLPSPRCTA